jgi:hypothetical protein
MRFLGPVLMVALVITTITGMRAATSTWSQERSERLYREIEADIQQTLWQHEQRKVELATVEQKAPATTSGISSKADAKAGTRQAAGDKARPDDKARKAKIASIRKRAAGQRRERFVPPDFARLPVAISRGVFGFMR